MLDDNFFYFLYSFAHRSPLLDALIVFFASYLPFLLVVAFVVFSFFLFPHWKKRFFLFLGLFLSGIIARGIFVSIIRFFYHRPRPFLAFDIDPLFTSSSFSFPSGHASLFFALSFFLFFFSRKVGGLMLFLSFLVGVFRVVSGVHYPSDILGGIILGFLSALLVYKLFPSRAVFSEESPQIS